MVESLSYVVEDSTLAELLGKQNFSTDESAILELVKNAFDAGAQTLKIIFSNNLLTIEDNGVGMDYNDIKEYWMHVGKSHKVNKIVEFNGVHKKWQAQWGLVGLHWHDLEKILSYNQKKILVEVLFGRLIGSHLRLIY